MRIPEEELWENLKISNDFMFAKVMRNPELCKGMLERLLDISIDRVEYPEEQKVIDIAKDSKSVRLGVYLKDEKGTVYNIEIQTTNSRNIPKRTRFYQGMIDLNAIEKGADYSELPQSFVIFICTFDVFGESRWKYTFENICRENMNLSLQDGTTKIFFNTTGTKGNLNKQAVNVLKFIEDNTIEDDFTKRLAQEVQKIKENKEWKVEYMTLLMREREKYQEGMAEGEARGRTKGKAYGIMEFAIDLGYTKEEILAVLQKKLNIDRGQAEEYLKEYYEEAF
ncbi:MAG: Rpn family recombination-promoting nuclease/putative transposase [Lachnospiraceae bacterium]|nr:Rpn family recombination-promoting nuclease/putative transposase [Lachnospiraceae bacterium]